MAIDQALIEGLLAHAGDPAWLAEYREQLLITAAQADDSPGAFEAFFEVVNGLPLTDHAREWVQKVYDAKKDGKYAGVMAFRGSAKTTVMVSFVAFRIGKNPTTTNLVVQVGDEIAADNSDRIADIISHNPGWKKVFPHIVPDIQKGWSRDGYEIMDNSMPYTEWRAMNATRKDPNWVGLGYKSRSIIGKRVTGILLVDDILDENNTASDREMQTVEKILTGTIFPVVTDEAWVLFAYTPWKEQDPVVTITKGPDFILCKTPIYRVATESTPGAVFLEPHPDLPNWGGEWVVLTWPDRFDVKSIRKRYTISGTIEFARMYLLDLTKTLNAVFKRYSYPGDKIQFDWPMVGGIDYAGTMDAKKNASGKNDMFAMAYVAQLPTGGAVVVDGIVDRPTQEEAEHLALKAQSLFPGWRFSVVEGDGKGEEFIQVMLRHPRFSLVPMKTGGKSKAERLERQMSPWFESMRVRISDAETPFLNELRREMDQWPNNEHDDALDAVYWALRGIPDALQIEQDEEELPDTQKKKRINPFSALGGRRR